MLGGRMKLLEEFGYAKQKQPLTQSQKFALHGLKYLVGIIVVLAVASYAATFILDLLDRFGVYP